MTTHLKGARMVRTADLRKIEDISERLDRLTAELEQTARDLAERLEAMRQKKEEVTDD